MTLLAPPADGSVVPFLLLQTKSALREAGADPHDVSDALFCYRRAIDNGQTIRDAAIWALRFFYLISAATAQPLEGAETKRAVRAAYERVIRDRGITDAATTHGGES